jgi:hypothetical protein
VIVRIFGEGQFELDNGALGTLDELDDAVVAAVERGDDEGFRERFVALLGFVRDHGHPLSDDELSPSDYILPPGDLTFEEARSEFTGEGLIPDVP